MSSLASDDTDDQGEQGNWKSPFLILALIPGLMARSLWELKGGKPHSLGRGGGLWAWTHYIKCFFGFCKYDYGVS